MFRLCTLTMLVGWMATGQSVRSTGSELLNEANAHYRENRPQEAARLYREFLAIHPERADVRVFLGGALLNLNQPDAALEEARRAIRSNAHLSKAYVLAGRIYAQQHRWKTAQEFFAEATKIDPADRDAWYFSGRAHYEAGELREAVDALSRAGSHSRVHETLGLALQAEGRVAEAEAAYRRAVEVADNWYRPYLSYGMFLFKQSRVEESLAMLTKASKLAPDSVDVAFELARVLYQSGRYREALSVLPSSVSADHCRVHNLRGRILIQLNQPHEAQGALRAFSACAGDDR